MEECKVLLSGITISHVARSSLFMKHIDLFSFHFTGNMQHMDDEKKGLWKTLMERFSKSSEDVPEKTPEK